VGNTVAITAGDTGGTVTQRETRQYDAVNRVITDTVGGAVGAGSPALVTGMRYDQDGNVAQTQQPNGDVVYNIYDAADRLTTVELDPAPLTKGQAATHPSYEAYGYDQAGNQTVSVDADNRTTTTQYDGDNRLTQSVARQLPPRRARPTSPPRWGTIPTAIRCGRPPGSSTARVQARRRRTPRRAPTTRPTGKPAAASMG